MKYGRCIAKWILPIDGYCIGMKLLLSTSLMSNWYSCCYVQKMILLPCCMIIGGFRADVVALNVFGADNNSCIKVAD